MDNFFLDLHFHQVGGGVLHSLLDIAKKLPVPWDYNTLGSQIYFLDNSEVHYFIISSIFQPVIIQLHNNCELNMSPQPLPFLIYQPWSITLQIVLDNNFCYLDSNCSHILEFSWFSLPLGCIFSSVVGVLLDSCSIKVVSMY